MPATAHTMFALSVAAALAIIPNTREDHTTSPAEGLMIHVSGAYNDGLMFSNNGAMVFLHNHAPRQDGGYRLKLETDACGVLVAVRNGHALLHQSRYPEDWGEFDENDPSVEAQILFSRWLSTHPEIAMISDGLDKSCGDFSFVGDEPWPEFRGDWGAQTVRREDQLATSYIA